MASHAAAERPRECCGLLIGTEEPLSVVDTWPSPNLAEGQTRFLVDPVQHFAAIRAARARGLEVVGVYHSHPATAAVPSARDLEEGGEGAMLHVIVSLSATPADIRAYRYDVAGPVSVPITRVE